MTKEEKKIINLDELNQNDNIYRQVRDEVGYSRNEALEELDKINFPISSDRLGRIEGDKFKITPEEVIALSEIYKAPTLCNYYCTHECPIGKKFMPKIKVKDLEKIVLEMLSSLNTIKKSQDRLIEISADGIVDEDEIEDFVEIQQKLEKVSITVESLKLWVQQMLADNTIDRDVYEEVLKKKSLK